MWKVPLFDLNYNHEESHAVQEVLESKWLTMGQKTIAFEQKFSELLNEDIACSFVSNCSSALYMSLKTLDIKSDDEIIVPALTFVADVNSVLMAGGKPVLADCESKDHWNVTAQTIRPCITNKTKAVIIVHYAGYPCKMDEILALCKEHNLFLIEDVAHAPGASYKGRMCGTMGDVGCFSFFTNKNLSIGEGGMLSTKDEELSVHLKHLRSHGMSSLTLDRHKGRINSYDVIRPGLNFRSDEIHAALGLVQLSKLNRCNAKRKEITEYYRQQLSKVDGISIPFTHEEDIEGSYHIFPILLDCKESRHEVIEHLKADKIQSSIHYPSFHNFTAFKELDFNDTPIANDICDRELTLPLYPNMSNEQVDLVVQSLQNALKK